MNKNWKLIAQASGVPIPWSGDAEPFASLQALDAAFRPLVKSLAFEVEPAIVLSEDAVLGGTEPQ